MCLRLHRFIARESLNIYAMSEYGLKLWFLFGENVPTVNKYTSIITLQYQD